MGRARERLAARQLFAKTSRLRYLGLLTDFAQSTDPVPLLAVQLRPEERVVGFLLGSDVVDAEIADFTRHAHPPEVVSDSGAPPDVDTLVTELRHDRPLWALFLRGDPGSGRTALAVEACHQLGFGALVIDAVRMMRACPSGACLVTAVLREAALAGAAVCWENADALWGDDDKAVAARDSILARLPVWRLPMAFNGPRGWQPPLVLPGAEVHLLDVPELDAGARREAWESALRQVPIEAEGVSALERIAVAFRLTAGQVRDAATVAQASWRGRGADGRGITAADLFAGARGVSSQALSELAQEIAPRADWSKIVLAEDAEAALRELVSNCPHP